MKMKQLNSIFTLFFSAITIAYAGDNSPMKQDAEFDAYRALQTTRQMIFNDLQYNTRVMLPFSPVYGVEVFGVDDVNSGVQRHKQTSHSIFAQQYRVKLQPDG
jgi:hypothetical protein